MSLSAPAEGAWRVDAETSHARFTGATLGGLVKIPGQFRSLAGSLTITPDRATDVLEMDAASLDTRNRLRDRHLRSPRLLCRGRAPTASLRGALARPGWAREAPARESAHSRRHPDRVAARR
jgi:polyisoprenoid-binding protein YceI